MERKDRIVQEFMSHRLVTEELIQKLMKNISITNRLKRRCQQRNLSRICCNLSIPLLRRQRKGTESLLKEARRNRDKLERACQNVYRKTKTLLESFTDEELDREVDLTGVFGRKVAGEQLLQLAIGHEIHHKGNLFVYVREMGHTDLPLYVKIH